MIKTIQAQKPTYRAIIILDSIGALVTRKTVTDINKDEQKLDRGLRARLINDFIKSINMPCLLTDTSTILVNHTYQDPNALYASPLAQQGGGLGIQYMSRMMLQCSKKLERNIDKKDSTKYLGNTLTFLSTKNFLVQPYHSCAIDINFKEGFRSKYTGLLDLAIQYGFVEQTTVQSYTVPSWRPEKFKCSRIWGEESDEIWGTFIDDLNEAQKKEIEYGSIKPEDVFDTETFEENNNEKDIMTI